MIVYQKKSTLRMTGTTTLFIGARGRTKQLERLSNLKITTSPVRINHGPGGKQPDHIQCHCVVLIYYKSTMAKGHITSGTQH